MIGFKSGISLLITAGAVLAAATATAAESGFYIGGNVGTSFYAIDSSDADALIFDSFAATGFPTNNVRSSVDKNDTAFSGTLGYRFMRYIAIEGSYVDTGNATVSGTGDLFVGPNIVPMNIVAKFGSKGPVVSALGIIPLNAWELYARLGVYFAKSTFTVRAATAAGSASDSVSANTQELVAGFGAGYNFSEKTALRLDWQRLVKVGDVNTTGEGDIGMLTLGFFYRL